MKKIIDWWYLTGGPWAMLLGIWLAAVFLGVWLGRLIGE